MGEWVPHGGASRKESQASSSRRKMPHRSSRQQCCFLETLRPGSGTEGGWTWPGGRRVSPSSSEQAPRRPPGAPLKCLV